MIKIIINEYFTLNGVPQTGLTPLITIYEDGDDTEVVDGVAMTEYGNGWYYYTFSDYNQRKRYIALFDGTATITVAAERYKEKDIGYHPI